MGRSVQKSWRRWHVLFLGRRTRGRNKSRTKREMRGSLKIELSTMIAVGSRKVIVEKIWGKYVGPKNPRLMGLELIYEFMRNWTPGDWNARYWRQHSRKGGQEGKHLKEDNIHVSIRSLRKIMIELGKERMNCQNVGLENQRSQNK